MQSSETWEEWLRRSREAAAAGDRDAARTALERAIEVRAAEAPDDFQPTPQAIAAHFAPVVFTGGPPEAFEEVGRESLIAMLENGLYPHSNVLDIGSGSLRIGYWLINFLQPGRYFGLDPDRVRTTFGIEHVVGREVVEAKGARFDHDGTFDLTVFGATFDFFVARSIWTHASKAMIRRMLDGFVATATESGVFLASYVPADDGVGYEGDDWVDTPLVAHAIEWVGEECRTRDLAVQQLPEVINEQPWLRIERARADLPAGVHGERAVASSGSRVGRLFGR